MKFGIYILFFNRISLSKTIQNINNVILSESYKEGIVNLHLIDDCSNSESFIEQFNYLKEQFKSSKIIFTRNQSNLNIIQNPINIFKQANENFISLIADDDSIEAYHLDNYVEKILNDSDKSVVCYVNDFNEILGEKVIKKWKLRSYLENFFWVRCLIFLFNQTDMYLYGFYKVELLKKYNFNNFLFFSKSPTSWAYTLPFFVLTRGKIKNIEIQKSWNYNSDSDKQYIEYNEKSKFQWYLKYILREFELHCKYIYYLPLSPFSLILILILPVVFIHKNFKRIVLSQKFKFN